MFFLEKYFISTKMFTGNHLIEPISLLKIHDGHLMRQKKNQTPKSQLNLYFLDTHLTKYKSTLKLHS